MRICDKDCLNMLVRSVADGGTGYPEWIVAQITDHYVSSSDILEASQNSGLSTIDWVDAETVKKVFEWMIGKTFSGVTISKWEDLAITEDYIEGTRSMSQPEKQARKSRKTNSTNIHYLNYE